MMDIIISTDLVRFNFYMYSIPIGIESLANIHLYIIVKQCRYQYTYIHICARLLLHIEKFIRSFSACVSVYYLYERSSEKKNTSNSSTATAAKLYHAHPSDFRPKSFSSISLAFKQGNLNNFNNEDQNFKNSVYTLLSI